MEEAQVEKLKLDQTKRAGLAAQVKQGYDIDRQSLSYTRQCWEECKKLVSMLPETSGSARFDNASNVNIPIVLNASMTFGSRAYASFFKSNDVVKCEVIGDDSGKFIVNPQTGEVMQTVVEAGAKQKRASRVGQHMSWQLLYKMKEWIEDQDKMLHLLPIYGCMFKKIYYDSYRKCNVSELILPQYLVVHNETKSLETSPRVTHAFGLYPYEIQERIQAGFFDDFTYINDDSGEQHEFLEQHLRYDLDGDGYDEPLIVWYHTESGTLVRVEKRYIESDKKEDGSIEAENFFVKVPFMPNPTGGFYDIGFGYMLFQLNRVINTTVNQLVDAGTLGNSPFFLLERGRMKGGEVKVRPGFGMFVNNDSRPLRDSVYQMTFNGPDQVLFQMLGFLFEYARNLGGMREVLEGGMRSDQAAGSTLMSIQEGMNEFKAIFKRIYRALGHEYKRLFELNGKYLDETEYFRVLDSKEEDSRVQIHRKDYNTDDYDVMPIADPEYLTNGEKMAKSKIALEMASAGLVNTKVATKMALQAANFENVEELLEFEPPTKPELELEREKMELQRAAVEAQGKEAMASILKEQNREKELHIKEAETLYRIDLMKAETLDKLAQAEERSQKADLEIIKRFDEKQRLETEKELEERRLENERARTTGMESESAD